MRRPVCALLAWMLALPALALDLDRISDKDAVAGLRQALVQGAEHAVSTLGAADGFLGNPRVRIDLPPSLRKGEGALRMMGLGGRLDELEVAMNRAAEAAVVEAKPILVNAVARMSVQDAKGILGGGETAATEYFRRTTADQIGARFLPIVRKYTEKLGVSAHYDQIAGPAAQFGLIDREQATLDGYVTRKAVDGLFLMVADRERAIRSDPVGQGSELLRRVFGAVK